MVSEIIEEPVHFAEVILCFQMKLSMRSENIDAGASLGKAPCCIMPVTCGFSFAGRRAMKWVACGYDRTATTPRHVGA